MGDLWGIGGFRGGGEAQIKQNGQKISKIGEIRNKIGKFGFFLLKNENGLKCIKNPTKRL